MAETENQFYRTGLAWCIQHPVTDGVACGVAFFIASSLLIGVAFPAWAVTIPITDSIVINLGDLQPWIASIIAFAVYWEMRKTKQKAAEAVEVSREVAIKVDGVMADRDKAKVKEGQQREKIAGEEKAETLAQGQKEGRDNALASVAAATKSAPALAKKNDSEIPVTDVRATEAAERTADAMVRVADANEAAAEEKKKDAT